MELCERVACVARAAAAQLEVEHLHARHLARRQATHGQPVLARCAARGQLLVRRKAIRDQQHLLQTQRVRRRARRRQMSPVDGVEGSAIYADSHTRFFLSGMSSIFRRDLSCCIR